MKLILYTTVDKLHRLGKQNCKQASINLNEFALFLSLLHHIGKAWLNTIWPTLHNTALCRLSNVMAWRAKRNHADPEKNASFEDMQHVTQRSGNIRFLSPDGHNKYYKRKCYEVRFRFKLKSGLSVKSLLCLFLLKFLMTTIIVVHQYTCRQKQSAICTLKVKYILKTSIQLIDQHTD